MKNASLHNFKFKCAVSVGIAASTFLAGGLLNEVSANSNQSQVAQSLLAQYNNLEGNAQKQDAVKDQLISYIANNGGSHIVGHLHTQEMDAFELRAVVSAFVAFNDQAAQNQTTANDQANKQNEPADQTSEETTGEEVPAEETEEVQEEDEASQEPEGVEEVVEAEPVAEEEASKPEPQVEVEPEPELPKVRQTNPNVPNLQSSNNQSHVVRAGETLNSIARQHNLSTSQLASINNLSNPNKLKVGQVLKLHNQNVQSAVLSTRNNAGATAQTTGNQPLAKTGNAFIDSIAGEAVQVANEHNLYPSVMIAQATLESGYGSSALSKPPHHNLFGIKGSYNGQSASWLTKEDTNRGMITIRDNFRSYPNYSASFRDNADRLRKGVSWDRNYYSGTWRENTNTYRDATQWLTGRYATDRNYNTKLNSIIERWGLTRFDNVSTANVAAPVDSSVSAPSQITSVRPVVTQQPSRPAISGSTYTVQSGDTLYSIAKRTNSSVGQLQSLNNLANPNLLRVGQSLRLVSSTPAPSVSSVTTPATRPNSKAEVAPNYTVQSGDTLFRIAINHNTSVPKLRAMNNLTGDLIVPGQVLKVAETSQPAVATTKPAPVETKLTNQTSQASSYTVKPGDTLYKIGQLTNSSVSQLKALNNLTSDLIHPGQTLRVSGTTAPAAPAPSRLVSKKQTPVSAGIPLTYTVKSGDTLSSIARRYNLTVSQLQSWNQLANPNVLMVGQTLQLKLRTDKATNPNVVATSANYTVKAGDTLYGIARAHNTSVASLKALNNLTSDLIIVGQNLRVR